jgi:hypothetical protein
MNEPRGNAPILQSRDLPQREKENVSCENNPNLVITDINVSSQATLVGKPPLSHKS